MAYGAVQLLFNSHDLIKMSRLSPELCNLTKLVCAIFLVEIVWLVVSDKRVSSSGIGGFKTLLL